MGGNNTLLGIPVVWTNELPTPGGESGEIVLWFPQMGVARQVKLKPRSRIKKILNVPGLWLKHYRICRSYMDRLTGARIAGTITWFLVKMKE